MGSLCFDYEIFKKNHLNVTANYANIGNDIFVNDGWLKLPAYSGYSIGYGLETIFGPVEIKQSWSPETKDSFTWLNVYPEAYCLRFAVGGRCLRLIRSRLVLHCLSPIGYVRWLPLEVRYIILDLILPRLSDSL